MKFSLGLLFFLKKISVCMNEIGLKCLDYFSKVKLPGLFGTAPDS